ncbi:AraC family transcriptional regulator [Tunicatimonas pelagia]|uniref:AraC family transcriptional regulator n=1 Tax=Tunicatimonas pelagia TaxID=931531 RepID=UPI00266625CE|nr:AraC family transcriptional regulator [Tunicatimonas pelagia]WKN42059.1 AraC family transcriptional regulator [Tunicatimonas pelagia]
MEGPVPLTVISPVMLERGSFFDFPALQANWVFILDGQITLHYKDQQYPLRKSFLIPHYNYTIRTTTSSGCKAIVVRFPPFSYFALRPFVHLSARELSSQKVFLAEDIFGSSFQALKDRLAITPNVSQQNAYLQSYLQVGQRPEGYHISRMQSILDHIDQSYDFSYRVDELCQTHHITPRTLNRYFYEYLGTSPKYYLREHRFSRILRQLLTVPGDPWKTAVEFGLTDQNHLIKEVKAFTGFTPSEIPNELHAAAHYTLGQ